MNQMLFLNKNFIDYFIMQKYLLIIFSLLLAACSNLTALSRYQIEAPSNFSEHLAKGYTDLAKSRKQNSDWVDGEYFAGKALKVIRGENVGPESSENWMIDSSKSKKQLGWGLKRLNSVLNETTKQTSPKQLAHAQVLYDCWVEHEAEKADKRTNNNCRLDFLMAVSALENQAYLAKNKPAVIPKIAIKKSNNNRNIIYFRFASAEVDTKGIHVIDKVLNTLKGLDSYVLELAGHTDTAGPAKFNKKLSEARAKAVAKEFVKRGINKNLIYTRYYGEGDLAVKTPDNTPNRKNRRVVIELASKP